MLKSFVVASSFLLIASAQAQALCPNQSTTITIPLSGTASMVMYDQGCNPLLGTDLTVVNNLTFKTPFTLTTIPAVTVDAVGINFSANGAARGLVTPMFVIHVPSGKTYAISTTVGPAVTSILGGTTTP